MGGRRRGARRRPRRRRRGLGALVGRVVAGMLALTLGPVVALRWIDPPTSSIILQHRIAALARDAPAPVHVWTSWEAIAPVVPIAVVAAEDQRFPTHRGFDIDAIRTALAEAGPAARPRGASTITQQVAKNLFLWSGRSWVRKGLEAYFTVLLELAWPKRRILEVYLNVAQLGPDVYGVGAASATYFAKPPGRLAPGEAALLAAALPNPRARRPDRPSAAARRRAAWILRQIDQLGGPAYLAAL